MHVKKFFVSLMLFASTVVLSSSASAIVLAGSTYSIYLQGELSGNAALPNTVFDDETAFFDRAGVIVALSESDTALGGGNSRISLNLSADGDLFPAFGEGALLGVGTSGDVLDFDMPVSLYDARVTVRDLNGAVLVASDNLADFAQVNQPWDGSFPTTDTVFRIFPIGGLGASNITFDFYVSEFTGEVPEPASLLLCGIGLLAAAATRRKRGAQA